MCKGGRGVSSTSIRDTMLAVYRKQSVDRVPVGIYSRYLGRGSSERELRNLGLGVLDFYPIASLVSPPWHTYEGYVSQVPRADFHVRYVWEDGERIEIRTYDTPVGSVSQHTRVEPTYGSEWITRPYVQSRADYRVLTYLADHTVLRNNYEALSRRKAMLGEDGVLLGRMDRCPFQKVLIELAGPERSLLDIHTDPEPVLELLEALDRKMNEAFALALDSEADVIWQPDNVTSATTPPNSFKRFCLPFYERHGSECRQAGKPYFAHLDGRLKALKDLIAQAPIDGVESLSLPETGGDLGFAEARSAWPDKTILPNFPASLSYEERKGIEAFLERLLSEARGGLPTMLQFSEDIPPAEWKRVLRIVCEFMAVGRAAIV